MKPTLCMDTDIWCQLTYQQSNHPKSLETAKLLFRVPNSRPLNPYGNVTFRGNLYLIVWFATVPVLFPILICSLIVLLTCYVLLLFCGSYFLLFIQLLVVPSRLLFTHLIQKTGMRTFEWSSRSAMTASWPPSSSFFTLLTSGQLGISVAWTFLSIICGDSPFWVLSYDWSPLGYPKNQIILPKNPPTSPPQAINNDRFQEKMRGQRGRLPVQALGYVNSAKVILGLPKTAGVLFLLRKHDTILHFLLPVPINVRKVTKNDEVSNLWAKWRLSGIKDFVF